MAVNPVKYFNELENLGNVKDYWFSGNTPGKGWKIHLFMNRQNDVLPPLDTPVLRQVSKYLIDKNITHKYGNGSDGARSFTIYIGDRDDMLGIANEMNALFGREFAKLSPDGSAIDGVSSDYMISPNIGFRFDGTLRKLSEKGVPRFYGNIRGKCERKTPNVLGRKISDEQESRLQLVAAHIILAKYYGATYLGKDYKNDGSDWDKYLFDSVSEFSADDIAKYVKVMELLVLNGKLIDAREIGKHKGIDIRIKDKLSQGPRGYSKAFGTGSGKVIWDILDKKNRNPDIWETFERKNK